MSLINTQTPNDLKTNNSFNPVFSPDVENAPLDRRIRFPCYKSFDAFIDVERLKSLDEFLTEKIRRRIETRNEEYFLNAYRLNEDSRHRPGAREIWLSRPVAENGAAYSELDKIDCWRTTPEAADFAPLMDFVFGLPFKATGRILIIYDDAPREVPRIATI